MEKKIIVISIIIVLAIAAFAVYKHFNKEILSNDGTIGVATFSHLTHESGFGLDIDNRSIPLEINVTSGKLNVKITDGKNVIFEETDITEPVTETVSFVDQGYYFMMLSGKNATGTIKYPVATSANTPSVVKNADEEAKKATEELLKTPEGMTVADVLFNFFKQDNDNVEELRIDKLKIYTKEEIEKDDALKTYTVGEKDIVFDASYSIKFKEASDDMIVYTAASGEIEDNWVTNKFNCGFCVYDEKTKTYSLDHFGTAF